MLSDSGNNELFIINLATVPGRKNSKILPAQSRKTLLAMLPENFQFAVVGGHAYLAFRL